MLPQADSQQWNEGPQSFSSWKVNSANKMEECGRVKEIFKKFLIVLGVRCRSQAFAGCGGSGCSSCGVRAPGCGGFSWGAGLWGSGT